MNYKAKTTLVGAHHELYEEDIIVHEVLHKGLEPLLLVAHHLEVDKGVEDDGVTALHQTDGRQKLQYQSLRPAHIKFVSHTS